MHRIIRISLLIGLLFFLANTIVAQERRLNKAEESYKQYSFKPAIDIYEKLRERGYVDADLLKRLGNSYYYNADYDKAAKVYQELMDKYDTTMGPDYYFRFAQSLKTIGSFKKASNILEKFQEQAANAGLKADVEVDFMQKIEDNSGRYQIKSFEYNSVYADFAPSFYEQGLIFASDRDTGNLARYRHTWTGHDFLDLYKVNVDSVSLNRVRKIDVAGKPLANSKLLDSLQSAMNSTSSEELKMAKKKDRINSRLHESTSVVTKDGKTIYFTRNNFIDGKRSKDELGTTRLKIYQATYIDGRWGNIIELPFNSNAYSVAHPALSPDEKFLYFASDMPGTFGESDLWKVKIVGDGTFGPPTNLGDNINTQARETFPFITNEDVLYFSSDGHPNLGGLDVFATKIAFNDYGQNIVNVGKPINSTYDDFTFIFKEDKTGYFASNRPDGLGGDDIYAFIENEPLELDCVQDITGTVRDRISNQILAGATVMIIDEDNKQVSSTKTDDRGMYQLDLNCNKGNFVRAQKEGYIPSEEYLPKSNGKPTIVDFYLERDVVTGGFGDDLAKLLQLSTIYFDLNKYDIRPDAEIEIQKVIAAMEKYPSLKLKVNSHTDSRGRDSYNLWLSQKRAESTVAYMISKGIASNRLIGEGFGETKLINECENGVPCSDQKHQFNRRSEFIIME